MHQINDESKRRKIIIVAVTIFMGGCLGYIYSYSKSNTMLTNKHVALKYKFATCLGNYQGCTLKLTECSDQSKKLQDSEENLKSQLESNTARIANQDTKLKEAQATSHKFLFDIGVSVGLFKAEGTSLPSPVVSSDTVTKIMEKVTVLKGAKKEFDGAKKEFDALVAKGEACANARKEATDKVANLQKKLQESQDAKIKIEMELKDLKKKIESGGGSKHVATVAPAVEKPVTAAPPATEAPATEAPATEAPAESASKSEVAKSLPAVASTSTETNEVN